LVSVCVVGTGGGLELRFGAGGDGPTAAPVQVAGADAGRLPVPAPAPSTVDAAEVETDLSTLGVDERANLKKLLERVGLQKFYEPLLRRLESVAGELDSPEAVEDAIESGLLCEIGMRIFEAARFMRMQKAGADVPTPSAMRMRDGQIVSNTTEFLFASKLSRYSAELLTTGGLLLEDLRYVTDEELLQAGIDKEFHRKRFLREARNLGVPDADADREELNADSDEHEPDLGDEPPIPELTSELDALGVHQNPDQPMPEPEPEPEPEPADTGSLPAEPEHADATAPEPGGAGRDQLVRTGSVEMQEFWSQCEPQARATAKKSAGDVQLYKMLSRTVAAAPPDDTIFNRRFKINKHHALGRGAFGVVVCGRDRKHRRDVAIKEVMPGRRKKQLGPWEIKQLVREARAASSVRHINVMQCYAYHRGARDRRFFLVMELLQGPNLEQVLKKHGPVREARVVEVMSACLDGLAAIHDARLIHRDIKLNNIVLHLGSRQSVERISEVFCVGPIWGQHEVPAKPEMWIREM
jgi:hypothetical protein